VHRAARSGTPRSASDRPKLRAELQLLMTRHAGVLRHADTLARAERAASGGLLSDGLDTPEAWELRNLAAVGAALVAMAAAREETRGGHNRTDFPQTSEGFRRHLVLRWA
jgi:L-aspartate oxidase